MTVTGIKEAGHTEIKVTTVLCCRGCCSDNWISRASCLLPLTDTTGEALQLPLSHICLTYFVSTIRFLSEYTGRNFAPADLIIMTGMVSVLL